MENSDSLYRLMYFWIFRYAELVFIIAFKEKITFANVRIGYLYIMQFVFVL